MRPTRLHAIMLTAALAAVEAVVAAEEPLVTDRPDFTESALAVDRGRLQLEMGATFDDGANLDAITLGELLVRWGFAEDFELRVLTPTYLWVDAPGGDSSGFLDMGLGVKYEINDGEGDRFWGSTAAGVILSTTVPTGASVYSSDDWQPAGVVAAWWSVGPSLSLSTNLGYARPSDGDRRFNSFWASVSLGAGFTDATSVFVELYGFDREEARGPSTMVFQTGIVYLLSPNLQTDARAARRLTRDGPDFLLGVGASWRY